MATSGVGSTHQPYQTIQELESALQIMIMNLKDKDEPHLSDKYGTLKESYRVASH